MITIDNIYLSELLNYILCSEFGLENHEEIEDRIIKEIIEKSQS